MNEELKELRRVLYVVIGVNSFLVGFIVGMIIGIMR